jgi:hypothetical protein
MVRKLTKKPAITIENIMKESISILNEKMSDDKVRLLLRLAVSGIANHYFKHPDDLIDVGFLRFQKSPDKDELFKVTILRDKKSGVINAEMLWKYYKGELKQEAQFKEILDNFLKELIEYSQEQEINIMNLTNYVEKEKRRTNYGI